MLKVRIKYRYINTSEYFVFAIDFFLQFQIFTVQIQKKLNSLYYLYNIPIRTNSIVFFISNLKQLSIVFSTEVI